MDGEESTNSNSGGIERILVVFKTHLDIGFTDFSENIVRRYNEIYIPGALAVGEEIRRLGRPEEYVWTTGSWLIHQYLNQAGTAERMRMEQAIRAGLIRWHALPFTLHSEYADAELYEYGLSLSRMLDQRFGVQTIAAKNTDVPGHTRSIVPLLAKAGVQFLHVGVNPASMPPQVPDFFRWRAPSGEELTVMYDKGDYGSFSRIPGTNTAVFFAHTGDNLGPQSLEAVLGVYADLHRDYPKAAVQACSLNEVAEAVCRQSSNFPLVTQEIGDTWIHGVGTDPQKTMQFRTLLRYARALPKSQQNGLYEKLLLVPEHTWGLDEKTFLRDHTNYARTPFEAVRKQDNYQRMEVSWQEQRNYITQAVKTLPPKMQAQAEAKLAEYRIPWPVLPANKREPGEEISLCGWKIIVDSHGAITKLENGESALSDEAHPIGSFLYESFSEKEVLDYSARYVRLNVEWAREDFGKIGLGNVIQPYCRYLPHCDGVYAGKSELTIALSMEREATELLGAPPRLLLRVSPAAGAFALNFDFAWFDKPANRAPEACWLGFGFDRTLTSVQKLGDFIDPRDVVSNGNREMHATDGLLCFEGLSIFSWDAPLFAVDTPAIYGFHNQVPHANRGVWFNLFNNQWGTNFPMWNSGDARFRFTLDKL